jgi:glyoxylase-like metal-dependent hydrolase (beta-lactamase superfamily II)
MQFASECRTPVDSKLIRIQKLTGDVDRVIPPRGNRHCKNRFKAKHIRSPSRRAAREVYGSGLTSLDASGIDAGNITKVVFTHAHPDHVWGTLTESGKLRFPNATYYVGAAEWNFWMDPDYRNNMPAVLHEFAEGAQRDLGAIKDRVVMLKPGDDIVTGLRTLDTAGHTPGHLSLEMTGGEGLIFSADAATNEIASFQHPKSLFGYDTIPDLAIKNRARLIERAATDRTKLLGYHWTYPGVGFAERKGDGYRYVPV